MDICVIHKRGMQNGTFAFEGRIHPNGMGGVEVDHR